MLRSQFLGGSSYFSKAGGFLHNANLRHGAVFIYSVGVGNSVQHTLQSSDFLPLRKGFVYYILNIGPGNDVRVRAQNEPNVNKSPQVKCHEFAEVFLVNDSGGIGNQTSHWIVKVKELRGGSLLTCSGATGSTSSSSSGSGSGSPSVSSTGSSGTPSGSSSGTPSGSVTSSKSNTIPSCTVSFNSVCSPLWTPSSDGDT